MLFVYRTKSNVNIIALNGEQARQTTASLNKSHTEESVSLIGCYWEKR